MSSAGKLLLLIGLGASYRIRLIGAIGVSEILVFLWAPFIFAEEFPVLRRNGFGTYFTLLSFTMIGCVVASVMNHTHIALFLRGFANLYSLFAGVVVIHHLLRKEPQSIKWLALGLAISSPLSFVLHGGDLNLDFEIATGGNAAFARMRSLANLAWLPVSVWYFDIPLWISSGLPFFYGVLCLTKSSSGRSLALTLMMTGVLAFVGRKDTAKIVGISKYFLKFSLAILLFLLLFKTAYTYLAPKGYLGNVAKAKYIGQTKGKKGTLNLLVGGRIEVFQGIYAGFKRPIFGFGPWAADTEGLHGEFLEKYGLEEEYEEYLKSEAIRASVGRRRLVAGHSHLISFWNWFGIFGLFFWLYVLQQLYTLFRWNIGSIPLFFGFICAYAPKAVWDIFFSPFSARLPTAALITITILMNKEGRKRRLAM